MKKSSWMAVIAVVGLAQLGALASCQTTTGEDLDGDPGGSGGSSDGGGSGGAGGGSGGVPNGPDCEGSLGLGGTCGTCEISLAEYCGDADCELPDTSDACFGGPRHVVSEGCGYRHVAVPDGWTSAPPHRLDVWDIESGDLVYHFERGEDADACIPDVVAGELPECGWSVLCDSGYACSAPPHIECHGCAPGCLDTSVFASCGEMDAAADCGSNGAGGAGGMGGGTP